MLWAEEPVVVEVKPVVEPVVVEVEPEHAPVPRCSQIAPSLHAGRGWTDEPDEGVGAGRAKVDGKGIARSVANPEQVETLPKALVSQSLYG